MITGRLKRIAGKNPKARLVKRQIPIQTATIERSTFSASWSSTGIGCPESRESTDGALKSTSEARVPPTAASNTASAKRYRASRNRLAPNAWRIDRSRSRIALRTCIMPEIFRHTTRSTAPVRVSAATSAILNCETATADFSLYGTAYFIHTIPGASRFRSAPKCILRTTSQRVGLRRHVSNSHGHGGIGDETVLLSY